MPSATAPSRLATWMVAALVAGGVAFGLGACSRGDGGDEQAGTASASESHPAPAPTDASGATVATMPDGTPVAIGDGGAGTAATSGSGDSATSTSTGDGGDGGDGGDDRPRPLISDGDCFDGTDFHAGIPLDPTSLNRVPCPDPHHYEVYGLIEHPSSAKLAYPGEPALKSWASDQCLSRFAEFVGKPYDQSTLDFTAVVPSPDTWKDGDRQGACLVYNVDFAVLTGSARGTGQ